MSTESKTTTIDGRVIQTFRIRPTGGQDKNEVQTKGSTSEMKERGATNAQGATQDAKVIISDHSIAKGSKIRGRHGG